MRGFDELTLERAWRDNRGDLAGAAVEDASCVPFGTYLLEPFTRPNSDEVWRLVNPDLNVFRDREDALETQGRYLCLFHAANFWHLVVGCIAPGLWHATMRNPYTKKDELAVAQSRAAIGKLAYALGHEETHELVIAPAVGPVRVG